MRLFPATSLVCVIDVQERLLAVIPEAERLVARVATLAEAAKILGVSARKIQYKLHEYGRVGPAGEGDSGS